MINLKIRINVDEQTVTLPVDTQSVPGIPEKDPVVMVMKTQSTVWTNTSSG